MAFSPRSTAKIPKKRNALGHLTQYTAYDPNGRPLSITDPNGTITTLSKTLN
ncbi:RHS repeat protein [Ferribacterium limneticum]|uniref:RHS repeat domain-containing protein n=1 Tax=Ferribacterium limneticum TaxID=76259 RepID=UPI00384AF5C1|nr:RHS repeat protein [Ferribacterium limneticum]UCV34429.1 RHS repeat protein [Ferribacterium limneticum]